MEVGGAGGLGGALGRGLLTSLVPNIAETGFRRGAVEVEGVESRAMSFVGLGGVVLAENAPVKAPRCISSMIDCTIDYAKASTALSSALSHIALVA